MRWSCRATRYVVRDYVAVLRVYVAVAGGYELVKRFHETVVSSDGVPHQRLLDALREDVDVRDEDDHVRRTDALVVSSDECARRRLPPRLDDLKIPPPDPARHC